MEYRRTHEHEHGPIKGEQSTKGIEGKDCYMNTQAGIGVLLL
jgi:hypothetical protein